MSKVNGTPSELDEEDLLPEYDFGEGVRGKHHQAYRQGHSIPTSHHDGTTTTQEFSASRTIANLTAKNFIVSPQSIIDEIEPNKYFEVKVEDKKIILTPVDTFL